MYTRPTTGNPLVDKVFVIVFDFMNKFGARAANAVSQINANYLITPEGGEAVLVHNFSGIVLEKGYLVRVSEYSTANSVTIAREDDYDIAGVVYEQIPVNGLGYMVVGGYADVFFNANGATARGYFQMSRGSSTVNVDDGKAQYHAVAKPDSLWLLGYVFESRTGEGLARCLIKK